MNEPQLTVKTSVFEGPLDLLLSMIEKRKLFINDISLSQVADDYIEYLEQMEEFPVEQSAHFVLIASTLVLIKSKSLLPKFELTEEEESKIGDLENRLAQYKRFKELAAYIEERRGVRMSVHPQKRAAPQRPTTFSPSDDLTQENISRAIYNVRLSLPKQEDIPQATVTKVISMEEMIDRLTQRIQNNLNTNLAEMSQTQGANTEEQKRYVIITFLAMLELVKQGLVQLQQERQFDDIRMEANQVTTPRYG